MYTHPRAERKVASYPVLRGTIRDHGTAERRDFIRFFACGRDLTLDPADDPLPDEDASGPSPSGWWGRWPAARRLIP
jgi:hypothetical protein